MRESTGQTIVDVLLFAAIACAPVLFMLCACAALRAQWTYSGTAPGCGIYPCVIAVRGEADNTVVADIVNPGDVPYSVTLHCYRDYAPFVLPAHTGQTYVLADGDDQPCSVSYLAAH